MKVVYALLCSLFVMCVGVPFVCGISLSNEAAARSANNREIIEPADRPYPHDDDRRKLNMKRRLAGELCIAMARSGAYADMDDNAFSDFCIFTATHIVDNPYDHTD